MKKHVPLGKKNTVEVGRSCGVQRCAQLEELTASSRERFVVVVDWNPFGYVTPKGVLTGRVRAFAPQSTPPAACVSGRGPRLPLPRVSAAGCGCRRCAPGVCGWAHRCALTGWVGVTWVGGGDVGGWVGGRGGGIPLLGLWRGAVGGRLSRSYFRPVAVDHQLLSRVWLWPASQPAGTLLPL